MRVKTHFRLVDLARAGNALRDWALTLLRGSVWEHRGGSEAQHDVLAVGSIGQCLYQPPPALLSCPTLATRKAAKTPNILQDCATNHAPVPHTQVKEDFISNLFNGESGCLSSASACVG